MQSDAKFFTAALAGHVDHGKTALLEALTGAGLDRLKEEKERGMTIDLGFAHLNFCDRIIVGFIDVPGHGKYVKNMIAGSGGIDLALLVVAANEGLMPETYQQAKILSLIGIEKAAVVVSKADLASRAEAEDVGAKAKALLEGMGVNVCAQSVVSAKTGAGLKALKDQLFLLFTNLPARKREFAGETLYLPLDRVFHKQGFGTIVAGTLWHGQIETGAKVVLEPGQIPARVRRLEVYGRQVESAFAGERAAVNLALKEGKMLKRGQVLSLAKIPVATSILAWFPQAMPGERKLGDRQGQEISVYHGTAECRGHLRFVQEVCRDKRKGSSAFGQITLSEPLVISPSARFLVRFADDTFHGGMVMMLERPRWLTRPKVTSLVPLFAEADWERLVLAFIDLSPQKVVKREWLERLLPKARLAQVLSPAPEEGKFISYADLITTKDHVHELGQNVLKALDIHQGGISVEALRKISGQGIPLEFWQELVNQFAAEGILWRQKDKVFARAQEKTPLPDSGKDREIEEQIVQILAGHICLEISELAKSMKKSEAELKVALKRLSSGNRVQIVFYEFAALNSRLAEIHRQMARLWEEKGDIKPSDLRELLSTSRKYVMPILSYFDDNKITRRLNSRRVLLQLPDKEVSVV